MLNVIADQFVASFEHLQRIHIMSDEQSAEIVVRWIFVNFFDESIDPVRVLCHVNHALIVFHVISENH